MEIPPEDITPLAIMIVESNPAEARLIAEAFRDAGLTGGIQQLHDGEEALSALRREPPFHNDALPDLILLDLNLPRKSGFEVLQEIRTSDEVDCIPIIILSGSSNPADIRKAYVLGANCYIRKPNDLDDFMSVIQTCYQFWSRAASLPPKSAPV
jgi:chemotaxis family two-component system response regulator Rcp1